MTAPVILTAVNADDVGWGSSGNPIDITGVVISGVNRYLAVCVGYNNNDFQTIVSVTIDPGGGDETSLAAIAGTLGIISDDGYTEMWGVADPPVGTFTVRVIITADTFAAELAAATAYPMTGVNASPIGDAGAFSGVTDNPSVTLTSSTDDIVIGCTFVEGPPNDTSIIDSPGVEDFQVSPQADTYAAGHQAGASSVTIAWTLVSSDKTVASAVSFAGVPAPGEPGFLAAYRTRRFLNPLLVR